MCQLLRFPLAATRRSAMIMLACFAISAHLLYAQSGGRGGAAASGTPGPTPVDITASRSFDMAQVQRGGKTFVAQCASCHGANARGGKTTKTDVDLLRSDLVQLDRGGQQVSEFLKFGRPEKGMPKFDLPQSDGVDVAVWLHHEITVAVERGVYRKLNVFSGDVKAGEAFFNGAVGKCNTCHSATGDLNGLGAKCNHDAPTLQLAIIGGSACGTRVGGGDGGGPYVTATVTLKSGEQFTGTPGLINDFVVQIHLANGEDKAWVRDGGWPQVTRTNRRQAHVDLMTRYTDANIHDLAAYLNDK
jgi:cytochrome c oxidase cbb3-type subunit 3